jgi:hypothetical protein
MSSDVPAEIQVLCLLARTRVSTSAHTRLNNLLGISEFNWDLFWQLAKHHGVQPLVVATLQRISPKSVRSQDQATLSQSAQANAHRNLVLTGALVNLVQAFAAQQVPLLAYKGAILALTMYGDVSLRRFADLDIWVDARHQSQAADILKQAGFDVQTQLSWEANWVHGISGVQVDLHQSLTPTFFPLNLQFEAVYARSQVITLAGTRIHTLCPEDNLLLLCVNLARDHWEKGAKLLQLCDIAELLRSTTSLDEHALLHQATRTGCRRMLLVGVALAQQLLDAPVGALLQSAIATDDTIASLTAPMAQQLLNPDIQSGSQGSRLGFYWQIRERWREKILYLLTPNEEDFKFKGHWSPAGLAYLIRPLRLAVQLIQRQ